MLVDKIIQTTQKEDLTVLETTLLSVDEYNSCKSYIPLIKRQWCLRSPGCTSYYVANVDKDGLVDEFGYDVSINNLGVRPALKISNHNLSVGDIFIVNGIHFTVINGELAICNDIIAKHKYDSDSNIYENSEIKEFLDNWWRELNETRN